MTQEAVNNAKVLYRLSVDREDVRAAQRLFFTTPVLKEVLESPVIAEDKKAAVLDRIYTEAGTPEILIRFIKVMCKLGNAPQMRDIFQAYYLYWDQMKHILRAELVYAAALSEKDLKEADELLQEKYPGWQVQLTQKQDKKLLGGYIIRTQHTEYDRSFNGRLGQLERSMQNVRFVEN